MSGKVGPYTRKKWNGDDTLSWAVFQRGQVILGLTGMSATEASYWTKKLNQEWFEKQKRQPLPRKR